MSTIVRSGHAQSAACDRSLCGQPGHHVAILGAGPAGLGAAYQLARQNKAQVTILELSSEIGGIAGSFDLDGLSVDYGSHRLHPACDPAVLGDIRAMLGSDLLSRPRHGRIRLRGRWIHFPLKPADLALRLPPSFGLGVAVDMLSRPLRSNAGDGPETFATVLRRGLGRTICEDFYFPYARKLWGLQPDEISATQAHRRVAANSLSKMIGKVMKGTVHADAPMAGRFYYPRRGFGQICDVYVNAAQQAGADLKLAASITAIEAKENGLHDVCFEYGGQSQVLRDQQVWSTIPITTLVRLLRPRISAACSEAANGIRYRAMVLVYLVLDLDRFSEYDAHYFPEPDIAMSRLSEPKIYRDAQSPPKRTVLCAEIPCATDSKEWAMCDTDLSSLVQADLQRAGLSVQGHVTRVHTRRIEYAYPLYQRGYEARLEVVDRYIQDIEGLLTFGRQGLFVHDNIHHALRTAYGAADCLNAQGDFDRSRWMALRKAYESDVVED